MKIQCRSVWCLFFQTVVMGDWSVSMRGRERQKDITMCLVIRGLDTNGLPSPPITYPHRVHRPKYMTGFLSYGLNSVFTFFCFYHGLLPVRQSLGHGAPCFIRRHINSVYLGLGGPWVCAVSALVTNITHANITPWQNMDNVLKKAGPSWS